MKKFMAFTVVSLVILSGCGSSNGGDSSSSTSVSSVSSETTMSSTEESTVASVDTKDLTYFYPDMEQKGKLDDLHVSVHSKLDNDNYMELDIMSSKFEPAMSVFVYVDGEQANIDPELATGLRKPTPIAADQIKKGVHSVELAQYENDDDTTEPVLYVRSTYEVE